MAIIRKIFYTPDNLIDLAKHEAVLSYSCNGVSGMEAIYCEDPEQFYVNIDKTIDVNTIIISKNGISISPATQFVYFLDKNRIMYSTGHHKGKDFHAFLDKSSKTLTLYNVSAVTTVKFRKVDSDVFEYKTLNDMGYVLIPSCISDLRIRHGDIDMAEVIADIDTFIAYDDKTKLAEDAINNVSKAAGPFSNEFSDETSGSKKKYPSWIYNGSTSYAGDVFNCFKPAYNNVNDDKRFGEDLDILGYIAQDDLMLHLETFQKELFDYDTENPNNNDFHEHITSSILRGE